MREVSISCSILPWMPNFYKWHERKVTSPNPHSRALLWLSLSPPPLQAPHRCVFPELSWPTPLFYRWGNCNPDRGRSDLPQIWHGVRGRARTRPWASVSFPPIHLGLPPSHVSLSQFPYPWMAPSAPFETIPTLTTQTTDTQRCQLNCLLNMSLVGMYSG